MHEVSPDVRQCAHKERVQVENVVHRKVVDGEVDAGTVLLSRSRACYLSKAQGVEDFRRIGQDNQE